MRGLFERRSILWNNEESKAGMVDDTIRPMLRAGRASLIEVVLLLAAISAQAQGLPPADIPPEIEVPIREMTFDDPTGIEGRVLYLDTYDEALWVEWVRVQDAQGWREVPGQRQFVLYPRDPAMMATLKQLPRDTLIRMRVQRGPGGKRIILSLDEL